MGLEKMRGWQLTRRLRNFFEDGKYNLKCEGRQLTTEEMIEMSVSWQAKYGIMSMEDMLAEDDWDGWVKLMEKVGEKTIILADDLMVTNTKRWQKAIEMKDG